MQSAESANLHSSQCDAGSISSGIQALLDRSGFEIKQENGQRRYGPPVDSQNSEYPIRGSEVFIGKIPRDCFEDELVPVFELVGEIHELRLMLEFSGNNKGYGFAMYTTPMAAKRAVKELNNYEIRKGKFIGVCHSVDNCRLFVGGIPKTKKRDDILQEMKKVAEGVVNVIVYPSAHDKTKNRGFAFVEFESHRAAAMSRRKLIPGRIQLWGHQIAVDWAEPEQEVNEEIMKNVKILYVRNLMLDTTEETLLKVFTSACQTDQDRSIAFPGPIERVKKMKDYAFIHYREREDALRAMNTMNGADLEGTTLEVVLAKPVTDAMRNARNAIKERTSTIDTKTLSGAVQGIQLPFDQSLQNYYASFGLLPQAIPSQYIAGSGQIATPSLTYRNLAGATVTAASAGIVAPGMKGTRNALRTAAGSRSASGGKVWANNILKSHRTAIESLEDVCRIFNLGLPQYHVQTFPANDGFQQVPLWIAKVTITELAGIFPYGILPPRYCRTSEEAKEEASKAVLQVLGFQAEAANGSSVVAGVSGTDTLMDYFSPQMTMLPVAPTMTNSMDISSPISASPCGNEQPPVPSNALALQSNNMGITAVTYSRTSTSAVHTTTVGSGNARYIAGAPLNPVMNGYGLSHSQLTPGGNAMQAQLGSIPLHYPVSLIQPNGYLQAMGGALNPAANYITLAPMNGRAQGIPYLAYQ